MPESRGRTHTSLFDHTMLTAARAVCVSMRRAVAPLLPAVVPMAVPLRGLVTTPPVAARKRKAAGRPGSV
mgnify:CR=1 FL=1